MTKVNESKYLTKQQTLDKTPENNYEVVLQNILYSLSKTKTEQIKRIFNELNTTILYKTQLRQLTWTEIYTAIQEADHLQKLESNEKKQ